MKRKFKIITAGTASLVLFASIGTVMACGDPKSGDQKNDDPKMLTLDEFQKSIIKSELGSDEVATESQKASLKAIYDKFSLEKSKSFKGSFDEQKQDGTKEKTYFSSNIYLLSKKGSPLEVSKDSSFAPFEGLPKMSSDHKEMYKIIRDNFLKKKYIDKYILISMKSTDKNGILLFKQVTLGKIMKKDNIIGRKIIRILNIN